MKKVLFVSKSKLANNLFIAILPFISVEIDLDYVESMEQGLRLSPRGKRYALIIVDWNVLDSQEDLGDQLAAFNRGQRTKGPKILLHPHHVDYQRDLLIQHGFRDFCTKPFLTEELTKIITNALK